MRVTEGELVDCICCMVQLPFFSPRAQEDVPGTTVASGVLGFLAAECLESRSEGPSKRNPCMYSCLLDKQEFSYLSIGHMTSFRVLHSSSDDYLKKPNLSSTGERSFLCSSVGKASAHNVGDLGLIPSSGSSPGEGNGNPLVFLPGESHGQRILEGYSPWSHKKSDMTEQLSLA